MLLHYFIVVGAYLNQATPFNCEINDLRA